MKKILFALTSLSCLLTSCLDSGNDTLVLPNVVYATPLEDIIPLEVQAKIKSVMPLYSGTNPPNIEGVYKVNPLNLIYTTIINDYPLNTTFIDAVIKFTNQNKVTNILTYSSSQGSSNESTSPNVSVMGIGNDFTAYFIENGISNGISYKFATVISGTKTYLGIQDYMYSVVMIEKGADPEKKLMEINSYRIFKDGNNLASYTDWISTSKNLSTTISLSQLSALSIPTNAMSGLIIKQ